MKMLTFTFVLGVVFLYFMNMAMLKTPIPNMEWSIHAGTRFLLGFVVLGVICFYAKALKLRSALLLTLFIVSLDYLYDYYTEAYRLNFQIILHGIYMLLWGALMGYLTARNKNN